MSTMREVRSLYAFFGTAMTFERSHVCSTLLRNCASWPGLIRRFGWFGRRYDDFSNHGLIVSHRRTMVIRDARQQRKLKPLHRGFDTSQGMSAQGDFVCGEDQAEVLLFPLVLEFGEGELIERQQQALFSRHFDFDRASVRIARPTFG